MKFETQINYVIKTILIYPLHQHLWSGWLFVFYEPEITGEAKQVDISLSL